MISAATAIIRVFMRTPSPNRAANRSGVGQECARATADGRVRGRHSTRPGPFTLSRNTEKRSRLAALDDGRGPVTDVDRSQTQGVAGSALSG